MDHRTVAAISVGGIGLDVLGGLYLAYDLLGGQHGPLRVLTRAVTYALVFGTGFALGLGLFFGVAAGASTGITLAIELNRAARNLEHYPLRMEAVFSAIRAVGLGIGLYPLRGLWFSVGFAALVTLGQVIGYMRGMRPSLDYEAARRSRLTRRQIEGAAIRALGYVVTALVCGVITHSADHPWMFAIRVGLVTGVVTAVGIAVNPWIEYYADNLPVRKLGVFGIWLVLCGFVLQSFQYWVTIFDIPVS